MVQDDKTPGQTAQSMTEFRWNALYVIADTEPVKGVKIKVELEAYYGSEVNHGRLYPNLDTLADINLIWKRKRDRRTSEYGLTARGKQVLAQKQQWQRNRFDADRERETATDGGSVEESQSGGKAENDDWEATMSTWGDGFGVEIKAEGNEARGEGPLVTADMTVTDHLAEETPLEGGERADEHEHMTVRAWESSKVRYTVSMYGDTETVEAHAEGVLEAARSALPEDCEQVEA